jgi:protein arginine N-methyltransferase 1
MVDHNEHGRLMRYHGFLLGGRERIECYARAIEATVRPGDRVLDLGAGTGVFALLALRAGAGEVVAIEDTPAIALAQEFARANGLEGRLSLVPRSSRRVDLPERARVLVTDTYASLGLQDGLLGSVVDARERLLEPGGDIVPRSLAIQLAPLEAADRHAALLSPWAPDLAGLDFSAGRAYALNVVQQAELSAAELLGPPATAIQLDLTTAPDAAPAGECELAIDRDGTLHGLAGWFTAELAPGIEISNAPGQSTTPYAQAWLPIAAPTPVRAGDRIRARVETRDGASWRWGAEIGSAHGEPRARFVHETRRSFPLLRE